MYKDGVLILFCFSKAVMSSPVSTCVCTVTFIMYYDKFLHVVLLSQSLHTNLSSPGLFPQIGTMIPALKVIGMTG